MVIPTRPPRYEGLGFGGDQDLRSLGIDVLGLSFFSVFLVGFFWGGEVAFFAMVSGFEFAANAATQRVSSAILRSSSF